MSLIWIFRALAGFNSFHQESIMMMMWRTNVMLVWGSYEQSRRLSRERHKNWARVTRCHKCQGQDQPPNTTGASSQFLISQCIIKDYHIMLWKPWSQNDAVIRNSGEIKFNFALPDVTGKDLESTCLNHSHLFDRSAYAVPGLLERTVCTPL